MSYQKTIIKTQSEEIKKALKSNTDMIQRLELSEM
jgi:glycerol-3-phosphate responsive antiterminator